MMRRGGIIVPIHQSEAMWLNFVAAYPFAVKIGTGKINAVNGHEWHVGLTRSGYVVLPEQRWLDGYCTAPGMVRQFVARRIGAGDTVEEQIAATEEGGIQIEVVPLRAERFFEAKVASALPRSLEDVLHSLCRETMPNSLCRETMPSDIRFSRPVGSARARSDHTQMGLTAGGRIRQQVYSDPWSPGDWDLAGAVRIWVHLCDAVAWKNLTGEKMPHKPLKARDYARSGLPWFHYYRADLDVLGGGSVFDKMRSVFAGRDAKRGLSGKSTSATPLPVKQIGPDKDNGKVSEWSDEAS
jgi:hypothetical protein